MIKIGKVGVVPLSSIVVGERAREDLGDLESLKRSMEEVGLITPLAVRPLPNGQYELLAGERRFTVLKNNNVPEVPVRIYDHDLSELEMKMIEKAENFYRKDMEFWEMDKLTLEIQRLGQATYGVKRPGPGSDGWSYENTSEVLGGMNKGAISMAIRRAEAREAMPEIFKGCKTASDANAVLKKIDEAVIKQAIAKDLESKTTDSALDKLSKCYIVKDFFEGVKGIPRNAIHLVEIDPPYAIDLNNVKKSEGESKYQKNDYNEIDANKYLEFLDNVLRESYRVMTDNSWLIFWFGMHPWFEDVFKAIQKAGFKSTRLCGIWTKPTGQTMQPQTRLANAYETFFYAWKGNPVLNKQGRTNIFNYPPVPPQNKIHPTERPVELMKEIYDTFAFPGSRILIPFLGSGNGLIAAHELGMSPIGFELSKAYKDSFLVRLYNRTTGDGRLR